MWDKIVIHMSQKYFGNTLSQYITAFLIIFIAIVLKYIVCSILHSKIEKWVAKRKKTEEEEKIIKSFKKPLGYLITLAGLLLACQILSWPTHPINIKNFLVVFFSTCITISFTWLGLKFIDILTIHLKIKAEQTKSKLDDQLVPLVSKSLKIFLVIVAFAVIIQNLGYSISGLLAGLGIGGLAIAMAAKDSLANLFGSVTIFLDNPFQVGDWIKAGNIEGIVEAIGFRSTRLRTFYKTQVSIPNHVIANMTIDNFSRMQLRRIYMNIGVTYETTPEQMEKALESIKNILKNHPGVYKDFFLVNFTEFGPSSLNIMLYYFTNTTDWQEYLNIRQEVNLQIMKAMKELGIEFAFQSMSVYLRSNEEDKIPYIKIKNI